MRPHSISLLWHLVLFVVMVISGTGLSKHAAAEEISIGPARLVASTGDEAEYLLNSYAPPAVSVLIASAGEDTIGVVLNKDPRDVFLENMPANCVDEDGLRCCVSDETLFLKVSYQDQTGWVDTGELCEATSAADGVEFIPIPEDISRNLSSNLGTDGCFMLLPEQDGTPRVLVNAPTQDSWRWQYCFNELAEGEGTSKVLAGRPASSLGHWLRLRDLGRVIPGMNSGFILAGHQGPPPQPSTILYDPPFCNNSGTSYRRCHSTSWHLFYKDLTVSYPRWTAVGRCEC